MDQGWCAKVVSGESNYVDEQIKIHDPISNTYLTWFELRPTMIQIPYFDYVELKKWIINECKASGQCDSRISSWDRTLENIDSVINQKMEQK